jgi:hypothetical protein
MTKLKQKFNDENLSNWQYELINEGYYQIYLGGHEIMKLKCSYDLMVKVVTTVNKDLLNAYKNGELKLKGR